MGQITAFNYEGITLRESLWINGRPYFSARAIGEFLEYSDPTTAISKIVARSPHINDPRWSTPTRLVGVEGGKEVTRTVRVYDAMGLQLIMFKSDQPKAIQYQIAAASLVIAVMNGELKPSKWALKDNLMAAAQQIKSLPRGTKRADLVRDMAERDDISINTAYRRIRLATGEPMKNTEGKPIQRSDKGLCRHPGEKEQALAYAKINPTARGAEIKRSLNLLTSFARINFWIREARK